MGKMKKYITKTGLVLLGLLLFAGSGAFGQSLRLDIRNQEYSGDTLFFDIYLSRDGGSSDYYLGNADFVLTYNNSNFSSPGIDFVANSSTLKNHTGSATTAYNTNIVAEIGSSNPNTNKILINVAQPSFSNQTQFEANIARIDTDTNTHRLGTFFITGMQDPTQSTSLTWYMSGSGIKTQVYTLNTSTPWKSSKINSYTDNNPEPLAEPTTQATSLTVSAVDDASMDLSWTRGNGDYVIILAKEASAVGSNFPTDGLYYEVSDSFSNGSQIGATGVYVVYRGTGTSTTVNKLDPATVYHFTALELNGSGGYAENYYTTSAPTATDTTWESEPTVAASGLTVSGYTTSTLDLSWTSGNGARRIVVAKAAGAVDGTPSDGSDYTDGAFTAGDDLGSGNIVVYDGTGNSATVTGLDPNVVYHFAVYEYNGTFGSTNYKTDSAPTSDRTTLQSEPSAASTGGSGSGITTTSITFSWNAGDGAEHIVLVKESSAVDSFPVDGMTYTSNAAFGSGDQLLTGNYFVYRGSDTFVTVTGLSPNTTYHYEVFEVSGSGDASNYLVSSTLTGSNSTLQDAPATSATNLTFTAWSTTTLDLSWTSGDGANRIVVAREGAAVSDTPDDTITYSANAAFGSGDTLTANEFVVYNGSGSSVQVTGLDPNTEYYFAVFEYNGSGNATNYKTDSSATNNRYTLQTEPTTASTGGASSGVTTTSITFSWNAGNGGEQIVLVKAASAVDSLPADGISYTSNAAFGSGDELQTGNYFVYQGTDTFVTVTGLSPNTTYYYEVFEVNGSGESSNYLTSSTLTGSQITLQDVPTVAASNLVISDVSTSEMSLSWTSGDGAGRIVVARAVDAVSATPVSGTTYSASATFASGDAVSSGQYVVYNGTGSSVTVTGLSQDTTYQFAVYEYNGASGSENFLTSSPATGAENTFINITVKAFLEGPFNGTDMDTTLNEMDSITTDQPYNTAPWNYSGTESVSAVPDDVVDWVLVELRRSTSANGASSDSIVDRKAGFLLSNGQIVDTSKNTLTLTPSGSGYGRFYVVIYHRNHVGVMSSAALTYDSDSSAFVYDFTTASGQAHGTNALIQSGSVYVLYGGAVDQSTTAIDADDRDAAWDDRNAYGYRGSDANMDGNVDAADRSLIYNNAGQDEQIP